MAQTHIYTVLLRGWTHRYGDVILSNDDFLWIRNWFSCFRLLALFADSLDAWVAIPANPINPFGYCCFWLAAIVQVAENVSLVWLNVLNGTIKAICMLHTLPSWPPQSIATHNFGSIGCNWSHRRAWSSRDYETVISDVLSPSFALIGLRESHKSINQVSDKSESSTWSVVGKWFNCSSPRWCSDSPFTFSNSSLENDCGKEPKRKNVVTLRKWRGKSRDRFGCWLDDFFFWVLFYWEKCLQGLQLGFHNFGLICVHEKPKSKLEIFDLAKPSRWLKMMQNPKIISRMWINFPF